MHRNSRRGMVDLIFMILMIVLVIGMGTLAFFAFDAAQKEKLYVARIQQVPAKQQAELDSTKARYAEVCEWIGFKGNAEFSSEAAIRITLQNGVGYNPESDESRDKIKFYSITAATASEKGTVRVGGSGNIVGVGTKSAPVYEYTNTVTMEKAFGAQDKLINDLVNDSIPMLRTQRELQRKWRDESMVEAATNADAVDKDIADRVEADKGSLESKAGEVSKAEEDLGTALREENEAFSGLNNEETRKRTEKTFDLQREILLERQKSNRVKRDYRSKADSRIGDDSRDVDGAIFQVDEESGWVWINIGKASDVRLNSTFQVLRSDTSNSAEISIGEIRVKELLGRNVARCRVDNLDDPNVYPQQGDLIRNPNYSKRQYQTYALVGQFGGEFSDLTRQQIVDMLRGAGFTVVSKVNGATDALIVGGNWKEDPEFIKSEEESYNLEILSVEDVLYFLGRSSD
ncbi:hypothetical protein OAU50_00365 [Planctomycetota bacterium]|nr:hypothetical protein [Planctomycetota bacterium]